MTPTVDSDDPASQRVLARVAELENADPVELEPLYDAIDPEALDRIVDSIEDGSVQFDYHGYTVTVFHDGSVEVTSE